MNQFRKLLIAHRGVPGLFHENTIESFFAAVQHGADMIEFDVRRTNDRKLVVYHDPFILYNRKRIHLADISYSELQKIALSKGFSVPTVEQVIKNLHGLTKFDIELKEKDCEADIAELIATWTSFSSCFLTSFKTPIIEMVKKLVPEVKCGILINRTTQLPLYTESKADFLCPQKKIYTRSADFFRTAKKNGKSIAVWTVDGTQLLKQYIEDPTIDAVITNKVTIAHTILKKFCRMPD